MMRKSIVHLTISILVFILLYLPIRGAIVDDTYIHLQYARNLVTHHEISFNPGEPTYGATSPLWVFLLSVFYLIKVDPVIWCRVLSTVLAVTSLIIVYRLSYNLSGSYAISFIASLLLASEAWFIRWSAVGMETSLAVFMITVSLYLFSKSNSGVRNSVIFGIFLFLSYLARPELILAVPLFLFASAARWGLRRVRYGGYVVFVVLVALWLLFIRSHTGTFFPLTAGAKQGRIFLDSSLFARGMIPVKIIGATMAVAVLSSLVALIVGLVRGNALTFFVPDMDPSIDTRDIDSCVLFMILWLFVLPLAYVIMNFQIISRYIVPVMPALVILGSSAIVNLSTMVIGKGRLRKVVMVSIVVVAMLQSSIFYFFIVVPPTKQFTEGLNRVLVGMGKWLRDNTPSSSVIAVPDIGAVGYYSQRKILDLGGLVSPEINRIRREVDYEDMLAKGLYLKFHPQYLIDRSPVEKRFAHVVIEGNRFVPLLEGRVSSLGIRKKGPFIYVLYRIESISSKKPPEDH